jgi:hypothetical protein
MYRLTITLADGSSHSEDVAKLPRHYKSWLMHRLPYGTVFYGCTFTREVIA